METNTTPIINNDNISLLEENIPKDIEKYQIPGWANIIGEKAFANSYLEEITIPGTVKKISSKAFLRCLCLRKVVIEEGVEEIEDEAFDGCTFLTSITLPTTLKYIGDLAFRNCVSLKTIIIPEEVFEARKSEILNCLKKWQTELNNNEKNIDYEDYKEKISKKVADIELNIFKYIGAVNFKNYHL